MKVQKSLLPVALVALFTIFACSKKITNPRIEKLQGQEKVLALNSELNKLNIALEKENIKKDKLSQQVEEANKEVQKLTEKAKKLSDKLADNPGDAKLAKQAKSAANKVARNVKKASKLNQDLSESVNQIKEYNAQIDQIKSELETLDSNIKFVPNTNQ